MRVGLSSRRPEARPAAQRRRAAAALAAARPSAERCCPVTPCLLASLPLSTPRRANSAVDMRQLTASLVDAREGTGEVRAILLRAAFKPRLPGAPARVPGRSASHLVCCKQAGLLESNSTKTLVEPLCQPTHTRTGVPLLTPSAPIFLP